MLSPQPFQQQASNQQCGEDHFPEGWEGGGTVSPLQTRRYTEVQETSQLQRPTMTY